jgi:hypothetical protein
MSLKIILHNDSSGESLKHTLAAPGINAMFFFWWDRKEDSRPKK